MTRELVKPRTVAFVLPSGSLPATGGERNMVRLARSLDRQRFAPWAITRAGPVEGWLAEQGVPCAVLPQLEPAGLAGKAAALPPARRLLRALRALDQEQPCAPAETERHLATAAAQLDQLERRPLRIRAATARHHSGRLLSERLGLPLALQAADDLLLALHALRLRRLQQKIGADLVVADLPWDAAAAIVALHDTAARVVWYVQTSNRHHLGELLVPRLAHRVVACGEGVARARLGPDHQAVVAANGVPAERFAPRQPGAARPPELSAAPADATLVGTAGELSSAKGTLDLVQAMEPLMRQRRSLHLVLLGQGAPLLQAGLGLRIRASAALRGRVHFTGWVEQIEQVLPHLDLFVLASHAEGLPLVLCEAMASGVPCIASDIPGCREVAQGDAALLVPPGDPRQLSQALASLLDDAPRRRQLAARGRQRVLRRFTFKRMLGDFSSALEGVCA